MAPNCTLVELKLPNLVEAVLIRRYSKLYLSGIEMEYQAYLAVLGYLSKLYLSGIEMSRLR